MINDNDVLRQREKFKKAGREDLFTVKGMLKIFFGLLLWTGIFVGMAYWASPILGAITAMFALFVWAFFIAPRLAGQAIAAWILQRREKKQREN